jgi:PAS domain S-box-containing protein
MFGYDQQEFIGSFFGDYLSPGELEKALLLFNNALNSIHNTDIVSLIFKRKDGSRFFADLSGSAYTSEDGSKGVLGLIRDVTDKMYREIELKKLSRAVEQNPVSIVITNTEGIIEYVNHKMCEVTGYGIKELIGKNPSVLSSNEKTREEYKILWDTIKSGNDWKGEFHNRRKNGELYWESASISPIKNDKGETTHFLGIKEDITQRKILEELTFESEKRYRELFLNNPIPTYIFDEKTLELVEVNDATIEYYGYSREELVHMTLKDLRTEEDIPQLLESIKELGQDVFQSTKMRHRKKNGQIFPVEITSHSLPEKHNRRTRLVMAKDITETEEAAKQMELARKQAEAGDRLKTTFLNNISHEVRTPLNGIIGFAEIMSDPDLTDEVKKESLSMLYESSNRLIETITNYMDISLLTSNSLIINYKEFCPGEILKKVYDSSLTLCASRKLELELDLPPEYERESINFDPEIFRKILLHLLSNAIKFTDKGSVRYGYHLINGELEVFVKDTGIGIKRDSQEIIFDRFVKEDGDEARFSEGSGLGLAIVKGMVEILGGKVSVDSTPGVGSCFSFRIPLQKRSSVTDPSDKLSSDKIVNEEICILVAEDDETNYYFLNALIKKEIGAKVIHASNGKEAIDLFQKNSDIQLILMDIKMPVLNGIDATKQIKLVNKDIPVIAITAYAMAGDELRILAAGCDDYVSKPINKRAFLETIAKYIPVKKGR